jgi:hypothetical protein
MDTRTSTLERNLNEFQRDSLLFCLFLIAEISMAIDGPSVPRQILKDIPRPPNSASRDD